MGNTEKYLEIEKIDDLSREFNIQTGLTIDNIIEGLKSNNYDGIKTVGSINNFTNTPDGSFLNSFFVNLIKNGNIKIIFDIEINRKYGNLTNFNNCIFNKNIEFENSTFKEDVFFQKCIFEKDIFFENCIFDGKLEIKDCNGRIRIEDSEIGNLEIIDSNFSEIKIKKNIFLERVKISSTSNNKNKSKNNIISFDSNKINDLRIGHGIIDKLEINNIKNPSDSEINLGNLEINKLIFSNIRNLGKIRLYDINNKLSDNKKEIIDINNSSFGDSEFQNINMKAFKENKIYDNLFSDLKYTGIKWKYDILIDNKEDFGRLRDTYRTLKNVAENNNDSIVSNKFFEKEKEYYLKEISKINIYKKGESIFENIIKYSNTLGDRIVLGFSKELNNFGNNWIINLIWLFIFVYISSYVKFLYSSNQFEKVSNGFIVIYKQSSIYENVFIQYLCLFFTFILIYFLGKWIIEIFSWLFDKIHIFALIGIFISIYFLYGYKEIFNDFLNLLINPLYGFRDLLTQELRGIELLAFIFYKIFYIIIMWHLVVALKRTTKR